LDPTTWLRNAVAGFAWLTPAERRAIRDFTLLWSLFEARLTNTSASIPTITAAIERLEAAGVLDLVALERPLAYFRDRYAPGGGILPCFEALRLNGQGRPVVERVLCNELTEPAEIATALMIIVYRLRNNLFHGNKWNDGIHDQRENFRTANQILMALMDMHRAGPDA
jgi:hypothetical protein